MTILNKLARPMLAAPFVVSGLDALLKPKGHREPARKLYSLAERFGLDEKLGLTEPTDTTLDLITRASGAVFVVAGASLARSRAPRSAALALALGQIPVALANNPIWESKGEQRSKDLGGLLASAGLIGGALIASTDRSGKPSVGWRVSKFSSDFVEGTQKRIDQIGSGR